MEETIINEKKEPTEEELRQQKFLEYLNYVSKMKRNLPKDFAKNTLTGLVNTQYAMNNRKERRKVLARVKKQYKDHMKGLKQKSEQIEELNVELRSEPSNENNNNFIE